MTRAALAEPQVARAPQKGHKAGVIRSALAQLPAHAHRIIPNSHRSRYVIRFALCLALALFALASDRSRPGARPAEHAGDRAQERQGADQAAARPRAQARRARQDAGQGGLLQRHQVPPRDRRLHGPDRRSHGAGHRRLEAIPTCRPSSRPRSTSAAASARRAPPTPTAPTASSSSASATAAAASPASTRCGARWSKAWRTSTRSPRASRRRTRT